MFGPTAPELPRLICFDIGRVLIRLADNMEHACRRAGVDPATIQLSDQQREQYEHINHEANLGHIDHEQYLTSMSEVTGLSRETVGAICDSWLCEPFDESLALVEMVREAGILTACLTNTTERHWQLINQRNTALDLNLHRMDWQFASHLLHLAKPDDAVYAFVEKATSVIGEGILLFDDLSGNCSAAARRRWQVCHIDARHNPAEQMRLALRQRGLDL